MERIVALKDVDEKGTNLCFTYSPYSSLHVAVTCALPPLSYAHSKSNYREKKKWTDVFLPNDRHGALHLRTM